MFIINHLLAPSSVWRVEFYNQSSPKPKKVLMHPICFIPVESAKYISFNSQKNCPFKFGKTILVSIIFVIYWKDKAIFVESNKQEYGVLHSSLWNMLVVNILVFLTEHIVRMLQQFLKQFYHTLSELKFSYFIYDKRKIQEDMPFSSTYINYLTTIKSKYL